MTHYDFIIAGGGAAGLSLAYHLINSPLRDRAILIVDQDAKQQNDRTWCFWLNTPSLFDDIAYRVWHQLRFVSDDFQRVFDLGEYRYQMIRGIDYYRFTHEQLSRCPNVEFAQGKLDRIEDGTDRAYITVDGQTFSGAWIFDSTLPASLRGAQTHPALLGRMATTERSRYHDLKQHFKGWEIETGEAVFEPHLPTLFDFRTPQEGQMRFMYTLPFSKKRALIEHTLFSPNLLKPHEYDAALKTYVEETLGIRRYEIKHVETGIIPMTDRPYPRRASPRVMNIGTKGGRVKPSTGYAFWRIQRDSAAIVQSLVKHGQPFDIPADHWRFRLHDSALLQIMYRHPDDLKPIFTMMFKNNPIERVFRFLDETASLKEEAGFIASLPPWRFLQALFHLKVLRRT